MIDFLIIKLLSNNLYIFSFSINIFFLKIIFLKLHNSFINDFRFENSSSSVEVGNQQSINGGRYFGWRPLRGECNRYRRYANYILHNCGDLPAGQANRFCRRHELYHPRPSHFLSRPSRQGILIIKPFLYMYLCKWIQSELLNRRFR